VNILAVALSALMRAPRHQREVLAAEALKRIEESNLDLAKKYLLGDCIRAYSPLTTEQWEAFERLIRTPPYRGVQAMMKTWKEEGIDIGRRQLVLEQLEERFGPVSPSVRSRIESLAGDKLRQIGKALLKATSLRDLGLED
jgi:hypothetical protein